MKALKMINDRIKDIATWKEVAMDEELELRLKMIYAISDAKESLLNIKDCIKANKKKFVGFWFKKYEEARMIILKDDDQKLFKELKKEELI